MDYKKIKASQEAITRDVTQFDKNTGNLYETIVLLSKRANKISSELRQELVSKIAEFSPSSSMQDGVDEYFDNKEQADLAAYYEKLPKPTLMAVQELLEDNLCFRRPEGEK